MEQTAPVEPRTQITGRAPFFILLEPRFQRISITQIATSRHVRSHTFTMRRISGKHAGLASCGVALVALAASLPTLVEMNIKENVRASVVVDTYKAWHKKQRAPAS